MCQISTTTIGPVAHLDVVQARVAVPAVVARLAAAAAAGHEVVWVGVLRAVEVVASVRSVLAAGATALTEALEAVAATVPVATVQPW